MADKDEPALLHIEGANLPPGASASCVFGGAASAGPAEGGDNQRMASAASAGAAAPAGVAGSVVGRTAATLSGETTALCRSPVHGARLTLPLHVVVDVPGVPTLPGLQRPSANALAFTLYDEDLPAI